MNDARAVLRIDGKYKYRKQNYKRLPRGGVVWYIGGIKHKCTRMQHLESNKSLSYLLASADLSSRCLLEQHHSVLKNLCLSALAPASPRGRESPLSSALITPPQTPQLRALRRSNLKPSDAPT